MALGKQGRAFKSTPARRNGAAGILHASTAPYSAFIGIGTLNLVRKNLDERLAPFFPSVPRSMPRLVRERGACSEIACAPALPNGEDSVASVSRLLRKSPIGKAGNQSTRLDNVGRAGLPAHVLLMPSHSLAGHSQHVSLAQHGVQLLPV